MDTVTLCYNHAPSTHVRYKFSLIITTMACKFMVNSAFEARLLLRTSHQRAVLFRTAYELGCPIAGQPRWPLILNSRTYSEATPTPPRPKNSGFTKGLRSLVREDMNWSSPKVKNQIATRLKSLSGLLFIGAVVRTSSFSIRYLRYANY